MSVLYDVLKSDINDTTNIALVKSFDKVLSLDLLKSDKKEVSSDLEKYILEKIEERKNAKASKDYLLADKIRDELLSKGVKLIDTKDGVTYELL